MTLFATAFDFESADLLAELDVPAFKFASGDLRNTPLQKHVAAFGKPMFLSTGGGTLEDVERAVDTILPLNDQLCVLQCTAAYPASTEDLNLNVITTLRERFPELVIGLSDHQNGIAMAVVAYMLGARVIEKHFTLDHALKGRDHAFSLMPEGMRRLVRDLHRVPAALGDATKRPLPIEADPIEKMGKKLVAARELEQGHVLALDDLAIKSPADGGLPPYELDRLVGRRLRRPIAFEDFVTFDDVEPVSRARRSARRRAAVTELEPLLERVRFAIFDFDGVFTDNRVWVNERGEETARLLAQRRARAAPARRGRRAVSDRLDGAEPDRRRARAEAGRRLRAGRGRQAVRRARAHGRRSASRSTRPPTSATTSTTPTACVPSACRSCPPTPGRRWRRSRSGCSRGPAARAACESSATPCGRRQRS